MSRAASVGPVAIPWVDRQVTHRQHKFGEVGQITEGAPWAPLGAARYAQSAVRSCPLAGHCDSVVPSPEFHCSGVVGQDRRLGKTQRSSPGARRGSQDVRKIPWIARIVIPDRVDSGHAGR